ncbi:branched-chain amino acid ABC transporter permease [Qingshengfaniella alkalisoli]|uniref:Branched-chain amino acid ABC transporter permease n=1 Tax=Qingshengfaniella alkalisoli TaxID=2599296 RepID=A0A5B8I6E9_9RHOB|nr:branched-chain amino acid ABC transporter permease [Qingshengfaniella alkalisoli]
MFLSTLIFGLVLGGTYALIALGLTMQYGIARIMNLAYGEVIVAACFGAYLLFSVSGLSPILSLIIVAPAGFILSWIVYAVMMRPLVARSGGGGKLEVDSILATFGLLFVLQGVMLVLFGANFTSYAYLDRGVNLFGVTVALNRLIAFLLSVCVGGALYLILTRTRWGTALRAVALAPEAAPLVGLDVNKMARLGFALGGMLAAVGGVVVSMYQTFSASDGVVFTMKALVVVIMGGVGNVLGAVLAGLFLGLTETFVAAYIDPGLTMAATYGLFLGVLLWRPQGLFGKAA